VVSRTVQEGAYGEDEVGLAGAAVDRIAVKPSRNGSGELESVAVTIRISESIDPATVAAGARLETIAAGGTVVRSWPAAPTLFDNFTLGWTLTASEWNELTATGPDDPTGDPATTPRELAISVTATLRAAAWSQENGILPPPDWALATRPIHTSRHPLEYREPLALLATSLQTTDEALLFEAPALSSLAGQTTPVARFIVASGFQALPFAEPATGLVYARARWYDPSTGTFLTPDPMGYRDSSNLYAFAGGDPVNGRDPSGEANQMPKAVVGEQATVKNLLDAGWKVIHGGPSNPHRPNAGGEDVLAFKRNVSVAISPDGEMAIIGGGEGVVLFGDDKNLQSKIAYDSPALHENFDRTDRVRKAMKTVQQSDQLTREEKALILRKLRKGDLAKAVMSGAEGSMVKGVGPKLRKNKIGFLPQSNLATGLSLVSLLFIVLDPDPAQAAISDLTAGGSPLGDGEEQAIATNRALQAVADELNRQQFIGPPAPKRIGASGAW
jgi:RHS repeat-associated protein